MRRHIPVYVSSMCRLVSCYGRNRIILAMHATTNLNSAHQLHPDRSDAVPGSKRQWTGSTGRCRWNAKDLRTGEYITRWCRYSGWASDAHDQPCVQADGDIIRNTEVLQIVARPYSCNSLDYVGVGEYRWPGFCAITEMTLHDELFSLHDLQMISRRTRIPITETLPSFFDTVMITTSEHSSMTPPIDLCTSINVLY